MDNYEIEKVYKNIKRKQDGSFVVIKNQYPYHIPNNDEFKEEYSLILNYITEYPDKITDYIEEDINIEDAAILIRNYRNILLEEADTLLLKYQEQTELGIIEVNENYRLAILMYKEKLRNIPEQNGFPENIEYPVLPKYEDYI